MNALISNRFCLVPWISQSDFDSFMKLRWNVELWPLLVFNEYQHTLIWTSTLKARAWGTCAFCTSNTQTVWYPNWCRSLCALYISIDLQWRLGPLCLSPFNPCLSLCFSPILDCAIYCTYLHHDAYIAAPFTMGRLCTFVIFVDRNCWCFRTHLYNNWRIHVRFWDNLDNYALSLIPDPNLAST